MSFVYFNKAFGRIWHTALWDSRRKNKNRILFCTIQQPYDKTNSTLIMWYLKIVVQLFEFIVSQLSAM